MPASRPTLFCLPALGMSGREFDAVSARLAGRLELVPIDLPGFGGAPAVGITVDEMAAHVIGAIRAHGATRWMLLGHSMGGKIAAVVAARVLAGEPGVFGLQGVVLLAASPLEPEPMPDAQRARMLAMSAAGPLSGAYAEEFLAGNVASPLPPGLHAQAIADLRRADPTAWTAWFERGSREDWSGLAGMLSPPTLLVAGAEDGPLGPDAQRALNAPRFPHHRELVVRGAAHLLPLEAPEVLAEEIGRFWDDVVDRAPVVPERWAATIASARTSRRTRGLLATRALADDPDYAPVVLSEAQLATLRLIADHVVPQRAPAIDLAARVDAQLGRGEGDGWRPADLPPDPVAYRAGLDALGDLLGLSAADAHARLAAVAHGDGPAGALSPAALAAWFEDARVDLVRQWVAHPATMARLDYDGFANGGDGMRIEGFQLLAAGTRERWEPTPVGADAADTTAPKDVA